MQSLSKLATQVLVATVLLHDYPGPSGRRLRSTQETTPWRSGSGAVTFQMHMTQVPHPRARTPHAPTSRCRFLKWTQDTFKAGGHQAELVPLLERCTRELQGAGQYKSDVRYLRLWIQYVSPCMAMFGSLKLARCQQMCSVRFWDWNTAQADCLPEPRDVFAFLKVNTLAKLLRKVSTPCGCTTICSCL